jgi:hypothetical protein
VTASGRSSRLVPADGGRDCRALAAPELSGQFPFQPTTSLERQAPVLTAVSAQWKICAAGPRRSEAWQLTAAWIRDAGA